MTTDNNTPKVNLDMLKTLKPMQKGLGKGLSALMGDVAIQQNILPKQGGASEKRSSSFNEMVTVPIETLMPNPMQPRKQFQEEALEELSESIKYKGILQPLLVRLAPNNIGMYEIIAGERRWRAAKKAGLQELPVIIRPLSDIDALEIGLIENLQREDLSPIEEAKAYKRLMDEFQYTQDILAKSVGKSRSYIANSLRLLNLPAEIHSMVESKELSAGHARTLVSAKDPMEMARHIIKEKLNVRQVEQRIKEEKQEYGQDIRQPLSSSSSHADSPHAEPAHMEPMSITVKQLEMDFQEALGTTHVRIQQKDNNRGILSITYHSIEDLEKILHKIQIKNH